MDRASWSVDSFKWPPCWFYWFQKQVWLYLSLWENKPPSHSIYCLSKQFLNELMISIVSFKSPAAVYVLHSTTTSGSQSDPIKISSPAPAFSLKIVSLLAPKKQDTVIPKLSLQNNNLLLNFNSAAYWYSVTRVLKWYIHITFVLTETVVVEHNIPSLKLLQKKIFSFQINWLNNQF